ncbi:peptidase M19, renal dipeptidase [Thalassotalea sp. M1531]|uniref:Peptidase M19, renal dipeptidase n=1 Tax=Thalassotalea algicola TaxID=2716224 RepID=A0A7Y0Q7K9_9GAMM|nr:membrane dipeptidase [Thalassotalea algicola]NMP33184.1 peptidase M19, renal dipeptidase [Thalassotalea algicola]
MLDRREFIKAMISAGAIITCTPIHHALGSNQSWHKYNQSIVIDGLCIAFGNDMTELSSQQLATIKLSGITAVNATIPYPGDNFDRTTKRIDNALTVINKYPENFKLIAAASDILHAKKAQQVGIILGFQSTEMFENDLSRIEHFAKRGVRYMQLTYNSLSQFGEGGLVDTNNGLSKLGIEAIKHIENNNVLLDVSHANKQTVVDAIKHANKPLTISHTGCNALYQHPRNNDDSELKAVADKGGVVGIYLMPFLEGGDHEITATIVLKHIKHAVNVCGIDHVSIGSDQGIIPINDGPEYREVIRKEVKRRIAAGISAPGETPNRPPFVPELNSERRMELIAWHLNKTGFNDDAIEKIIGTNLLSLYQRVW